MKRQYRMNTEECPHIPEVVDTASYTLKLRRMNNTDHREKCLLIAGQWRIVTGASLLEVKHDDV